MKDVNYYLDKIIAECEYIQQNMKSIDSLATFSSNQLLVDAMQFRLVQISENVKKIPEEYRLLNTQIEWNNIIGMRNRLIHDYGNVVLDFVFDTLKYDIPKLKQQLLLLK